MNEALQSIQKTGDKVKNIHLKNSNVVYEKFFLDCQDAFVFEDKPSKKIETNTMLKENAPTEWKI